AELPGPRINAAALAHRGERAPKLGHRRLKSVGDLSGLDAGRVQQLHEPPLRPLTLLLRTVGAQPNELDHQLLLLGGQRTAPLEHPLSKPVRHNAVPFSRRPRFMPSLPDGWHATAAGESVPRST